VNEETLAHWRLLRQRKGRKKDTNYTDTMFVLLIHYPDRGWNLNDSLWMT